MEIAVLALGGTVTAFATGAGAVPVFPLGERAKRLRPFLWGTTVGLMAVAAIVGLLLPALDEGGDAAVAAGLVVGALFPRTPGASAERFANSRRAAPEARRPRGAMARLGPRALVAASEDRRPLAVPVPDAAPRRAARSAQRAADRTRLVSPA